MCKLFLLLLVCGCTTAFSSDMQVLSLWFIKNATVSAYNEIKITQVKNNESTISYVHSDPDSSKPRFLFNENNDRVIVENESSDLVGNFKYEFDYKQPTPVFYNQWANESFNMYKVKLDNFTVPEYTVCYFISRTNTARIAMQLFINPRDLNYLILLATFDIYGQRFYIADIHNPSPPLDPDGRYVLFLRECAKYQ